MFDIITYQINNNYKVIHHLYQFIFYLGALSSLISTTYTTSTITSTMYTQSTLVYSTVISILSTTDASCVTLCTASMLCTFYTYKIYVYFNTVAIPVSMFLSSLLTAVIGTLIVYLIMRRRSYNKDTPPTTTTQLGPIYDDVKLPETLEQKEIIELQGNTAYGYNRQITT